MVSVPGVGLPVVRSIALSLDRSASRDPISGRHRRRHCRGLPRHRLFQASGRSNVRRRIRAVPSEPRGSLAADRRSPSHGGSPGGPPVTPAAIHPVTGVTGSVTAWSRGCRAWNRPPECAHDRRRHGLCTPVAPAEVGRMDRSRAQYLHDAGFCTESESPAGAYGAAADLMKGLT
jgi:hypothetical protein